MSDIGQAREDAVRDVFFDLYESKNKSVKARTGASYGKPTENEWDDIYSRFEQPPDDQPEEKVKHEDFFQKFEHPDASVQTSNVAGPGPSDNISQRVSQGFSDVEGVPEQSPNLQKGLEQKGQDMGFQQDVWTAKNQPFMQAVQGISQRLARQHPYIAGTMAAGPLLPIAAAGAPFAAGVARGLAPYGMAAIGGEELYRAGSAIWDLIRNAGRP